MLLGRGAVGFLVGFGCGPAYHCPTVVWICVEKLCSLQSKDEYDEEARKELIRLVGIDSPKWVVEGHKLLSLMRQH